MKRKFVFMLSFFMAAAGIVMFVMTGNISVLILTGVLTGVYAAALLWQRRCYERELIIVSDILENLIQGRSQPVISENADTLDSRLQSQVMKLGRIVTHYNERLLEEREEMRRFLSEIAHQIRTPLANMETYLSLLAEEELSEEERDTSLHALKESEQKIKFLTESFITASRMEYRIIQIRKVEQSLRETLAKAIFQVRKKADEKAIQINLECEKEIIVPHDKNWLLEAVANLLDNSIKYSPDGAGIWVGAEENEMFVRVWVRDFGIGIVDDENDIFRRFFRGKNVAGQEGFGIGLFIAREIVKKHDGFMKVQKMKQGTTVSIYLPC